MDNKETRTASGNITALDAKKVKKRSFELKDKCQDFSSVIFVITASAPKELRITICKKAQDISLEMVHAIRLANSCELGSNARHSAQLDTQEMLERMNDILPIMTRCRCITPEQETQLEKKLLHIKQGYQAWVKDDQERLEQQRAKKSSAVTAKANPSSN